MVFNHQMIVLTQYLIDKCMKLEIYSNGSRFQGPRHFYGMKKSQKVCQKLHIIIEDTATDIYII